MTVNLQATNEPFLKHLNVKKTPHVIVTAEDDDFDQATLLKLTGAGFNVQYVAMGEDSSGAYVQRLRDTASRMTGVNEYYAIVGTAPTTVLQRSSGG